MNKAGSLSPIEIGALVALVVAFSSITLKQSQVAVGFVLTLLCRDLSYFLGHAYIGVGGPRLNAVPIPGLSQIPILGTLVFNQDWMTYSSFILIFLAWFWIFRTRPGLMLRGIGERPAAAYVRGANVNRLRYIYTIIGGAIAGLAGPAFSLSVKAGWAGSLSGLDGYGWIALSITIFGGWDPFRAAFGVYLFAFLQWLGLILQPYLPGIPTQVLQVAPFPLMILTLLLVNISNAEWIQRWLATLPEGTRRVVVKLLRALRALPPASLGVPFESE
jgi:ABC-type uncharacterized transport system permease subunit